MSPTADRHLSPRQAATRAGVSLVTIRRYIRKGALKVIRRGHGAKPRLLVRESVVDRLFRE